jgi:hypothetical protein
MGCLADGLAEPSFGAFLMHRRAILRALPSSRRFKWRRRHDALHVVVIDRPRRRGAQCVTRRPDFA